MGGAPRNPLRVMPSGNHRSRPGVEGWMRPESRNRWEWTGGSLQASAENSTIKPHLEQVCSCPGGASTDQEERARPCLKLNVACPRPRSAILSRRQQRKCGRRRAEERSSPLSSRSAIQRSCQLIKSAELGTLSLARCAGIKHRSITQCWIVKLLRE